MKRPDAKPKVKEEGPWQRAVEVLGAEGVARLSRDFGGRRVYIPESPGPHHPLSVCLGEELAKALAAALPKESLEPPLTAGKRLRIVELLAAGERPERISHLLGCSRRFVFKVQAENQAALQKSRQLPLI